MTHYYNSFRGTPYLYPTTNCCGGMPMHNIYTGVTTTITPIGYTISATPIPITTTAYTTSNWNINIGNMGAILTPPSKDLTKEQETEITSGRILSLFSENSKISESELKVTVPTSNDEIFIAALKVLIDRSAIKQNNEGLWTKWPETHCKKCKAEKKERELLFTTTFGCMC